MSRPAYTLLASQERVGRAGGLGHNRVSTAIPSIDERQAVKLPVAWFNQLLLAETLLHQPSGLGPF